MVLAVVCSKAVVLLLLLVHCVVKVIKGAKIRNRYNHCSNCLLGLCVWSLFYCVVLSVFLCFAIILMGKVAESSTLIFFLMSCGC